MFDEYNSQGYLCYKMQLAFSSIWTGISVSIPTVVTILNECQYIYIYIYIYIYREREREGGRGREREGGDPGQNNGNT